MKLIESAGVVLVVAGIGALIGFGLYNLLTSALGDEGVPLVVRVALSAAAVGLFFVVVAVVADRLRSRKTETYEETDF